MDVHTLFMVVVVLALIAQLAIIAFVYMLGFHKGQHFERMNFPHTGRSEAPKFPPTPQGGQGR